MRTSSSTEQVQRVIAAERILRDLLMEDHSNPLLTVTLTMQQLRVLLLLARHDAIAMQELTRNLGVSTATVTGLVDRLAAHGYVTRREDEADRRIRRLSLTAEGRRVSTEILDAGARYQRRLLERLDAETLDMVETVLDRLTTVAREVVEEAQRR